MNPGTMIDQEIEKLWFVMSSLFDALLPIGVRIESPVTSTNTWMVRVVEGSAVNMFYGTSLIEALTSAGISLRIEKKTNEK
jgi:hypothetical protein